MTIKIRAAGVVQDGFPLKSSNGVNIFRIRRGLCVRFGLALVLPLC